MPVAGLHEFVLHASPVQTIALWTQPPAATEQESTVQSRASAQLTGCGLHVPVAGLHELVVHASPVQTIAVWTQPPATLLLHESTVQSRASAQLSGWGLHFPVAATHELGTHVVLGHRLAPLSCRKQ